MTLLPALVGRGEVLIPLEQDGSDSGHWIVEERPLTSVRGIFLLVGQTYVNLGMPANSFAWIRSQVIPGGIILALRGPSADQAVKAVTARRRMLHRSRIPITPFCGAGIHQDLMKRYDFSPGAISIQKNCLREPNRALRPAGFSVVAKPLRKPPDHQSQYSREVSIDGIVPRQMH